MYNETLLQNQTSFFDNMTSLTKIGAFNWVHGICIAFWVIVSVASMRYLNPVRSMTLSSFVLTILTTFLWGVEWITGDIILIPLIMTIAGVFIIIFGNQ